VYVAYLYQRQYYTCNNKTFPAIDAVPSRQYPVSTIRPTSADARISVPRPSPLVQSNVGISLPGARQVAPSTQGQLPSQPLGSQTGMSNQG
jgi:hypothetical protein